MRFRTYREYPTEEQARWRINEASPQQAAGYHKEGHCL
jgi:hypothetical protein